MTSSSTHSFTRLRCVIALSLTIFASACDKPDAANSGQVKWVDPKTIQQGPIRHETLPDELVSRIKRVQETFADVEGMPLEKWIDDFKRDGDPEGNVKIWEDMQTAYLAYGEGKDLPLETRKEVFKVVLMRSMVSEKEVLTRLPLKILTKEQAEQVMAGYPSPPAPITVLEAPK